VYPETCEIGEPFRWETDIVKAFSKFCLHHGQKLAGARQRVLVSFSSGRTKQEIFGSTAEYVHAVEVQQPWRRRRKGKLPVSLYARKIPELCPVLKTGQIPHFSPRLLLD
jgi:hypothetical protein